MENSNPSGLYSLSFLSIIKEGLYIVSSFIEISDNKRYDGKRNVCVKASLLLSNFRLEPLSIRWLCIGSVDDNDPNYNEIALELYETVRGKTNE